MAQETTSAAPSASPRPVSAPAAPAAAAIAAEISAAIAIDSGPDGRVRPSLDALRRLTRDQLLDYARRLGLPGGLAKLTKEILAGRIQLALETVLATPAGAQGAASGADVSASAAAAGDAGDTGTFPPKFDLGPDAGERP